MIFNSYIGIDYSGAETPVSGLPGLRVYAADKHGEPQEIFTPSAVKHHWTRKDIAKWLVNELGQSPPTIVGIDHGFSFPINYFQFHELPRDWALFLDDFSEHWPTDSENIYVDFVLDGVAGKGDARRGDPSWFRLTEHWTTSAKSVFKMNGIGQVGKSTHAGIPWLRFIRRQLGDRVHFWPFDGWEIPAGRSVIAEVYPSLWRKRWPTEERNPHQQDAFVTAAWLQRADTDGSLLMFLKPPMTDKERAVAEVEGWILGVL